MSKIEQTNENSAYRNQYVWDLQDKVKNLKKEIKLAWLSYDTEKERLERAMNVIADLCEKVPDENINLSALMRI